MNDQVKKNFVSNSSESTRMFKSNFLEGLSKVHYTVPLFIFIPVIAYFFYKGLWQEGVGLKDFTLSFILGLLVWTATEYVLHRFIFHFVPRSSWGLRLHFIFHGVHHDFPNDAMRLVMPPSVSIPLATLFFFLFNWILPAYLLSGFFAAFLIGYLFYDMSHYAIHHATFDNAIMKRLKQHHMRHHYQEPDKGYGVSSALWDKILGSDFKK